MNKSSIREQTKDKQIFENNLYSDDVLIRSTVENQRHVLPFISMIPQFVQEHKLYDLSDLSKYADRAVYSHRRAFDSDNTGMKDESKKEEQLEQYLDNKQKQQMRKMQLQDLSYKKNTLMCSNVMEINLQGCSFPIGLSEEKPSSKKSPQDSDLDDFVLDEDALEMLGDLALDEEIEDEVKLNRGIIEDKN